MTPTSRRAIDYRAKGWCGGPDGSCGGIWPNALVAQSTMAIMLQADEIRRHLEDE